MVAKNPQNIVIDTNNEDFTQWNWDDFKKLTDKISAVAAKLVMKEAIKCANLDVIVSGGRLEVIFETFEHRVLLSKPFAEILDDWINDYSEQDGKIPASDEYAWVVLRDLEAIVAKLRAAIADPQPL
jgi:hypothetical protein